MLTAAVVSTDPTSSAALLKSLQQSGPVHSVREWIPSVQSHPSMGEAPPDLVLLDLSGDPEPFFAFAAHLRRIRPTSRIIACSAHQQPDPNLLLQAMRSGVQEFLSKPIDPAALREVLARFVQEREAVGIRAGEKLIVVMGAKGGVGATTVAVNLAVQLVQVTKKRVVLLDLASPLGHVPLLLDLQPRFWLRDAVENLERLDGHFFSRLLIRHETGLEVLAGASDPEEWRRMGPEALGRVVNVARSSCDYVVVDAGTQSSSEWGSVLSLARAILLVAEANVPSLWTLERQLAATSALGVDPQRIRIVINRWCRADEDALKNVEGRTKQAIFIRLPNDFRQVSSAVNLGIPLSGNHGNSLVSRFRQLASQLTGITPGSRERAGGLTNLFSFSSKLAVFSAHRFASWFTDETNPSRKSCRNQSFSTSWYLSPEKRVPKSKR